MLEKRLQSFAVPLRIDQKNEFVDNFTAREQLGTALVRFAQCIREAA